MLVWVCQWPHMSCNNSMHAHASRMPRAVSITPHAPRLGLSLAPHVVQQRHARTCFPHATSRQYHAPCSLVPHRSSMGKAWKKLSSDEVRLARAWYTCEGLSPSAIAKRLRRNKSTMTRLLVKRHAVKVQGRPRALSAKQVATLVRKLEQLVAKAAGKYQVTVKVLRRSSRCKASERRILDALHQQNIFFRRMREKPVLTPADTAERAAFAAKYRHKSADWWSSHVHMSIDVKLFQVYLHGAAREQAAKQAVKGVYRAPGQGLHGPYVKPSRRFKQNTGAKSVRVLAGVGQDRVLVWEYLPENMWNGDVARRMYTGPIRAALQHAYPERSMYNVLEDNDPSGFKSSKGLEGKKTACIRSFNIPKRSPSLNVCDYALWDEVNRRMRAAEKGWGFGKKETRPQYLARLRRTALGLPSTFITNSVQDMRCRCLRLHAAKGGHFEEGGA